MHSIACSTCTFRDGRGENAVSQTVEITRYPNRRLYDRNTKQYVTLGDIEEMVREGKNVRVRDSKSQEDLTRVVLAQILLERHPERMQMFPVALLHEILRADQMSLDWLKVYLGQAKVLMESLPATAASGFIPGMDYWKRWMPGAVTSSESPAEQPSDETEESVKNSQPSRSEKQMAERLAELERRIIELEANRE